jgi:hypothetical protein
VNKLSASAVSSVLGLEMLFIIVNEEGQNINLLRGNDMAEKICGDLSKGTDNPISVKCILVLPTFLDFISVTC